MSKTFPGEKELPRYVLGRFPRHGYTAREVAERTGTCLSTAQNWTCEPREVYLERAKQRHERMYEMRDKGMSYRQIAKTLGVSVGTVAYAMKKRDNLPKSA